MHVLHSSEYAWIWLKNDLWQGSDYACSMFHGVLNKLLVPNVPGLNLWQSEYARDTQDGEFAWIALI